MKKAVCHDEQKQKHQGAKPYRVTSGGIDPAEHMKAQCHQDRDEDALVNAVHDRGKEAITEGQNFSSHGDPPTTP
jgi:hypothetical protein